MKNKLTITIPCYNQPDLLARCLNSLREQTYKDFSVLIIDDNSPTDYKKTLENFSDLKITYTRNEINKGAIGNIFNSITIPVDTEYKISLHEDDTLHRDYLMTAVNILDKNPEIAFVGSSMIWFKNDAELAKKKQENSYRLSGDFMKIDSHGFILEMLRGIHFALGSVVYRSDVVLNKSANVDDFSVLCDRPFLADILGDNFCAITKESGIFVRDHGSDDHRGDGIQCYHVLNMFLYYKKFIKTREEQDIFLKHSTNNIIYSYHRIYKPEKTFFEQIREAKLLGLISYRSINLQGILGIIRAAI